ncbi:ATP-binding protein [Paenibacillus sp. M1]|uniref:histidine kinase n=1 Tax=Paenibacillus haidiansis TaxID=1574488 RepID=A0ABU7VYZ5_9BACL
MTRRIIAICLISLIFVALIPLSIIKDNRQPANALQVQNGVMDLSAWDYEEHKEIKLDGTWEFYWQKLLSSEDFMKKDGEKPSYTTLMQVPSLWTEKSIDGKPLPAYGYATYRAVLKNLPPGKVFGLKKENIRFSSAIYANGHKLFEDGRPSGHAADYLAGNIPQMGLFTPDQGNVEIIIQVANYDYINAGIPMSLYFGEQSVMVEQSQKSLVREFGTIVILGTLALIFFICYLAAMIYRKQDHALLLSAVICLLFGIYHGLIGERSLLLFMPGISFETAYKLKDMVSIACFIVLAVFFYQMQKNIISLKFAQAVGAVLGCFLLLIPFLPIHTYTLINPYIIVVYESLLIWLLLKAALLYVQSTAVNRFKSMLLFMAILAINLYSLALLLFAFSVEEGLGLGQFYVVTFSLIMTFMIVLRFFEAYHTIDEMKNQLLRLDKIKDDFLSNTSHELKTPLNAIVNITDTLLKGAEGPVNDRQAHNLTIVMDSGRRLKYLVNDLLDYSKMKHGDIILYKNNVDLKAAVDAVIRVHLFLLGGKELVLVNSVPDGLPPVYADGNRLAQILHNLIGNAVKFSERGAIDISAEAVRGKVLISVSDPGIGIAPDMQERIFNAFEQGNVAESMQYGSGTGIGLSITKRLVELHGGDITVASEPGQGSVFTFSLPPATPSLDRLTASPEKKEFLRQDKAVSANIEFPFRLDGEIDEPILVVDDDWANLQSMINLFKLERYSVVAVNRGQAALEELANNRDFFLVILDITMPDMTGYELLKRIRERFSPFELPVLMLTATNRVSDMKISMENGANDFVCKPFEADELMARVRSLTRLKASVKGAKDAEVAFLRSQINPHFLYNALNSIAELCISEPEQAEALTLELSRYLRGSFDFKQLDSLSTLEKELELVEAYINIEKARFGTRLQVVYEIDASLHLLMPPLILQPLVENAIRHGLMSNFQGGTVSITVRMSRDQEINFVVEDNGCGMSKRKLDEIFSGTAGRQGVGLWNISQRIKLLYGRNITIESAAGIGTKVSFTIPAETLKRIGG